MGLVELICIALVALFVLIIYMHARYQQKLERKLFTIRLHEPLKNIVLTLIQGVVAGFGITLLLVVLGIHVSLMTMVGIAILSLILGLFHIRYVSLYYSSAIISFIALLTQEIPIDWEELGLPLLQTYFAEIDVASLLALSGIVYIIEALILLHADSYRKTPVYMQGTRGKLIGGYWLQGLWFVPAITILPSTWNFSFIPDSWPFIGQAHSDTTISFLPIFIGYSALAIGRRPKEVLRHGRWWMVLTGILIVVLSYFSDLSFLLMIAMLLSVSVYEVLLIRLLLVEQKQAPLYAHSNQGLCILDVLPNSPAAQMGLLPGEHISVVNGTKVTTTAEFYKALQINSAYCKMEVFNQEGQIKFVERPLYVGEHYLLGVIFAPEDTTNMYIKTSYLNLLDVLLQRVKHRHKES